MLWSKCNNWKEITSFKIEAIMVMQHERPKLIFTSCMTLLKAMGLIAFITKVSCTS